MPSLAIIQSNHSPDIDCLYRFGILGSQSESLKTIFVKLRCFTSFQFDNSIHDDAEKDDDRDIMIMIAIMIAIVI